jgi:nicotinate dehydrogenase subunit B
MSVTSSTNQAAFSRAAFLGTGGALVVSFGLPPDASAAAGAAAGPYPMVDPSQLDTWIAVSHDGTVSFFTGRIDFGQHKSTAFSQIVADELDVPYSAVRPVMGDTSRTPNQGASSASDGLLNGAKPVRHAAAEARRVLLERAAQRFGVDPAQLSVVDGVVSVTADPSRSVRYADLIGDQRFNVTLKVTNPDTPLIDVAGTAKLKDPSAYRVVGTSVPARDIPGKVTATWPRVHNVRLPGMLHARLILPPSPGAHVVRVDGFKKPVAGAMPIRRGDLVAVVAKSEWAAIQGAEQLAVEWTHAQTLPGSDAVFTYLRTAPQTFPPRVIKATGDTKAGLAGAARTFQATYNYPSQNHGMIGPSCGLADVKDGQVTVYAGTQDPAATRAATAKLLGVALETVRVLPVEPSGCYGRLGLDDATVAAAFLSQQLKKPVRVQLMRGQEHTWEPVQPPSTFDLKAGIDASGKIVAYDQQEWSWGWVEDELPVMLVAGDDIKGTLQPLFRPPGGGEQTTYAFANLNAVGNTVAPKLRGTAMRSPGRIQVNFSGEQFLDEIAAATGQDPIAFRLRHLDDNRSVTVLQAAAKAAGWDARPSPGPNAHSNARIARGRGVALVASQRSTWVATIAEVEVDRERGRVAVKRMTVAVDSGLIVNPVAIQAQIEGATIYATSRTLKEEVRYNRSNLATTDWISYPILLFSEVPEINIVLVNRVDQMPGGIGEPPNTTPAAAIGNAIFDATGVRIRELPYTPARVKAALA